MITSSVSPYLRMNQSHPVVPASGTNHDLNRTTPPSDTSVFQTTVGHQPHPREIMQNVLLPSRTIRCTVHDQGDSAPTPLARARAEWKLGLIMITHSHQRPLARSKFNLLPSVITAMVKSVRCYVIEDRRGSSDLLDMSNKILSPHDVVALK